MRLIREHDRRIKTGVPRSPWYALMAEGIAPKPVKLGARSVAWIEDELEAWMRELETKRERPRGNGSSLASRAPLFGHLVSDNLPERDFIARTTAALLRQQQRGR